MKTPSNDMITQVLLMQAAEDGRGPLLFGESYKRALALAPAFAVGDRFPSVYLEHPLIGDPYLDVTLLYNSLPPGTRIASPLAGDHESLMDWFAEACAETNTHAGRRSCRTPSCHESVRGSVSIRSLCPRVVCKTRLFCYALLRVG